MTLRISPLVAGGFAAEATGVDHTGPLDRELAESLRRASHDHPVLVVRTDGLTSPRLLGLAEVFGEPQVQVLEGYRLSDTPAISIIASDQTDSRGDGGKIVFGGHWHTDDSYLAVPARATMLYAHVIPSEGGDTLFADTAAAYDALDSRARAELDGVRAIHTYLSRPNVSAVPTRSASEQAATPPVEHPLVRTDASTGRRSLYLNPNRMDRIVGLDDAASDALLDRLIEHATQDRFVYRHVWQRHDVVLWDNGRSMHRAVADYGDSRREMRRILLRGTVPV
ncbi:MAG: taurine dioxygenase [Acidimicrobiaceae bacterium]|jgi:taurine dioxygenase|nr:taurine dioxygenase [Acidimicrobiaceae bacterium]